MSEIEEKSDITTPLVKSGVEKMIQVIRGKQVLFDRDLATLYGVETKYINRAVKRNPKRFPDESSSVLKESQKIELSRNT